MTVREPEWSADDLAALIASRRDERARRGPHGYTMDVALDPDNQFMFDAGKPRRDWALKALQDAQERYFSENESARGDRSLVWDVKLQERTQPPPR